MRRLRCVVLVAFAGAVAVLVAPAPAAAASRVPRLRGFTAKPALYPTYSPSVHDYVVRCDPSTPVRVRTSTAAGTVSYIDGQRGTKASVHLAPDESFTVEGRNGDASTTYHVRCLPPDFPTFTETRSASTGYWYIATPTLSLGPARGHYIVIFDGDGVPVWWYRTTRVPLDATLQPGPTIAYSFYPAGTPRYDIRRLDGSLAGRIVSPDGRIDDHELQRAPNGDWVFLVYRPQEHVDLSSLGGGSDETVLEAEIEEVSPAGKLVWSWSTYGHVDVSEASRWASTILKAPVAQPGGGFAYDVYHANAVSLGLGVVLLSLRQTDAIYAIDRATGDILWKLGGTPTPQSLTVLDDPLASMPLGGQHDVRLLPDDSVSAFDDGSFLGRPPRVVRYRIDAQARTATLIQQITDPAVTSSLCCGSARWLDDNDWAVSWGGDPVFGVYLPDGTPVLRMTFGDDLFSYRVDPVPYSELSATALRAGMDAMYARAATG